ncbi:MAG: hypothetical protein RL180_1175 [Pseudomonadota bacterium]|jgi:uncharacterized SAM-binding protein YcdF (DUF218 family)
MKARLLVILRRWLRRGILLVILLGLLVMSISTPFLSTVVLWGLNQVDYHVDPVAAAAHEAGALVNEQQTLETGSAEWQATQPEGSPLDPVRSALSPTDVNRMLDSLPARTIEALLPKTTLHNVALPNASATINGQTWRMAQVIVVLGGGLGRDYQREIVPNVFSQLRLSQAILQHQSTGLPIVLSGVEAPWMRDWLLAQGVDAALLEKRSMNTCENARFSALLLQKQGGAPRVELVTDAYHMPRARRLFAMNGIETIPVVAPLPGDPAPWWPDRRNLVHTRRAIHELAATIRDLWVGETNCREVP